VNFLIFVTTFVVLACVVLPLVVLGAFAIMRDAETGERARPAKPG
jgi:hypothetical protein